MVLLWWDDFIALLLSLGTVSGIFVVWGVILGAPGHLGRILAPSGTGSAIMSELL